jgi:hypothetical protein
MLHHLRSLLSYARGGIPLEMASFHRIIRWPAFHVLELDENIGENFDSAKRLSTTWALSIRCSFLRKIFLRRTENMLLNKRRSTFTSHLHSQEGWGQKVSGPHVK